MSVSLDSYWTAMNRILPGGTAQDRPGQKSVADIGVHGADQTRLRPAAIRGQGGVCEGSTSSHGIAGRRRRTRGTQSCSVSPKRAV